MNLRLKKRYRIFRHKIRRFLSRKISNRLILSYVALAVIPTVLISLYLIMLAQETVQEYIEQRNMETALRASNEINLFVRGPLTVLQSAALAGEMRNPGSFPQGELINRIIEEHPIFRKIFVLNDSGIVRETTKFGEENQDLSQQAFFVNAFAGEEYFSEVYPTESRFPVMTIAEPIRKYNRVVGVLAAEIDLNRIWTLVDQISIEETGIAFLVSADGKVIAHKNKEKVYNKVDYSGFDWFQRVRAGESGLVDTILDDEEIVLAFTPIQSLNWGVFVQQSRSEAFRLARQLQFQVVFFVLLMAIVALVSGILYVETLTRPLDRLVAGAREIGAGNLEHKIETDSRDELGELAQEFNSMASSLSKNQKRLKRIEHLAALSRFASLVSHEIRNPLNAMSINMQILKRIIYRSDVTRERKEKYFKVLSSEMARINDLVTDFLSIARPPELDMHLSNIVEILDEVLLLQAPQARRNKIEIDKNYGAAFTRGRFDYDRLKQVFLNLIINAFEAMPEGGTLHIDVSNSEEKRADGEEDLRVLLEFRDTGEGIPREILDEVFEYYYTTKRAGTGLGLALAKQIVEAHSGIVYIKSSSDVGTSVFINLPVGRNNGAEQ